MREQVISDVVARQFLLGQLSPEEQGRIQELAFEDRDAFAFLESVENDLIDEFIQGDLSVDEEQHFESHFLSLPGRRHNLKISRMLQQHFDTAEVSREKRFSFPDWFKLQSAWSQISIAAAVLALVIFAVWVFIRALETRQPAPIQAGPNSPIVIPSAEFKVSPSPEPTASPAHAENKPKAPAPERHKRSAPYAVLAPFSLTRGEGVRQLKLTRAPSMPIELALITQRSFRTYEAELKNEADKVLRRWPNLKAERLTSGKALEIDIPTTLLKPQESYQIVVSGVSSKGETEVIARYPFEVKE